MKTLLLIIIVLTDSVTGYCQQYSRGLIDSFCNETIEYFYNGHNSTADLSKRNSKKTKRFYMVKSDLTTTLRNEFPGFSISYLTKPEALEKIRKTKQKTGDLENISATLLSDTVKIYIGGWSVNVTETMFADGKEIPIHSDFPIKCSGSDLPVCMFVFNKSTTAWTKYTLEQLEDMRLR